MRSARPRQLPLDLGGDAVDAEFSGLCWWGDDLLLLPQFPGAHGSSVFALSRDSIARALGELESGGRPRALHPRRLSADPAGLVARIRDYDGMEALAVRGERFFALVEFGEGSAHWGSWLVAGRLLSRDGGLHFENIGGTALGGDQVRENFTHEALVLSRDEIWVLCELNGRAVVDRPMLLRFDHDLRSLGELAMPALEYRVTDASAMDDEGRFWVLNLFWPPDAETIRPASSSGPVERLVPLRRTRDGVVADPDRPILDLRTSREAPMHNWEGVARWGDEGFLLVTDSYPRDLLAFVPIPE